MEFRSNIIFSVIVHGSIAMMALAFAGRNAALSRLPENYIAVSLLEYANEKKAMPENNTGNNQDRSKKPETKSRKVLPSDSDGRIVRHNDEKVVRSQYPKNDLLGEGKALNEGQYHDTDSGQTLDKVPEQPVSLQNKPAGWGKGPGDNHPTASSSGIQEITSGKSMEVRMMGSHPASGGADSRSLVDRIRASIEKAKKYPVLAKKRGQEGAVLVEFSIGAKGLPENIRIVRSSGFGLLDAAAKETVIRAAPLPVVKGSIEVPITFILKKEN